MFPCMSSRKHFWRTLQLQWLFLEDVPRFARETCQEEPSKLLGTGDESRHSQRCEISEALSPRPSLLRSQIPQKHAATGFVMMHKRIFGPQIGAGTESLYRSQYRDNPLWITTNPDPCFYWRWQGTTGLFFLLAEFTARYSQCWELSETLSLKPQAYLIKTYIAYIRQNMQQNLNSWCLIWSRKCQSIFRGWH